VAAISGELARLPVGGAEDGLPAPATMHTDLGALEGRAAAAGEARRLAAEALEAARQAWRR
jgi:hypothetical protein